MLETKKLANLKKTQYLVSQFLAKTIGNSSICFIAQENFQILHFAIACFRQGYLTQSRSFWNYGFKF